MISSLCDSPEIGRERNELIPGLRTLPVKKYIIFYRVKSATLEIVRVLSGYRNIANL
ncbi:type II toxin-antitoxin system RelE/ParE family toxin, partial [Desulfurivibrio dismutans]|uniref:type II toxin-antitoxin system RelE/ParE family toxin n=1 Tax=Desulfurivibrio dismutans TaxID=1398908 RepID=UPI003D6614B6